MAELNAQLVEAELGALVATAGVRACALVEAGSGLVWHSVGRGFNSEPVWEASIDYWRLYQRMNGMFSDLGELGAAVMHHVNGMLVLLPCSAQRDLLVVCIADHGAVDWRLWQRRVRGMRERLLEQ